VRDIVVHGDDLALATYGRGFWVMDQIAALREIAGRGAGIVSANAYLFKPGESFAIVPGSMNGTPLPHEEPQEVNPPTGVLSYYWLQSASAGPVKLELLDAAGSTRVCAASDSTVHPVDMEAINVQAIWERPAQLPSAGAGMHRFALALAPRRFGRGAAAEEPTGACASTAKPAAASAAGRPAGRRGIEHLQPGNYTVRLTVNGQTFTQPVTLKPDPRNAPDQSDEGEHEDK
jgi:hypothetical protein